MLDLSRGVVRRRDGGTDGVLLSVPQTLHRRLAQTQTPLPSARGNVKKTKTKCIIYEINVVLPIKRSLN